MRYCPVCQTSYPEGVQRCLKDGQLTLALGNQDDPYLGKFAGSYQLIQKLGEGGMGVVYLAKHPTLGKRAAVKLLQADLTHQGNATERFFSEAQIVSQLGHENIVDVYDFGLLDGQHPFFVMEYLEGEPLSQTLAREQFIAPDTAIDITIQLLDALSVAHAHGVVHRDLKPDNTFLLPRRGRYLVKLLDFGIAKLKDAATKKLTKTGVLIGTPQYMSPEQVESEVALDGRADLYSVGILLYEMLCGRTPFSGNSLGIVALAHTFEPPPPPRSLRPELSPAIEVILLKSLEKDRNHRYQSAEEMIQALQSLQGQPLLVATDFIATPPHGSMRVNHSKAPSTNEKTGARENPFEEIRSGRLQVEEPSLPTMHIETVSPREERGEPAVTSLYSNVSLPTSAVSIGPSEPQESTSIAISAQHPSTRNAKLRPEVAALPPTMMTPIVSSELQMKTPPSSSTHKKRPAPDPNILPTMMTPIVSSPSGERPTQMISDALPTMMAPIVSARTADHEMPTMHIGTVAPKPESPTSGLVALDDAGAPPNREGVVPFSATPRNVSGAQVIVTPEAPSLDAAPEDVVIAPGKESRATTVAIVILSALAVVLWALAFR